MHKYLLKRLLLIPPTLFGAAILVFGLMRLVPGDVCLVKLLGEGTAVSEEMIQQCRDEHHLDDPLYEQFGVFLVDVVTLDFDNSMWTGKPVEHEIGLRFELTLQLALMTLPISDHHRDPVRGHLRGQTADLDGLRGAYVCDCRRGGAIVLAWHHDHHRTVDCDAGHYRSAVDATHRLRADLGRPGLQLSQLFLPALATGYRSSAILTRMTRSAMLEVLREDYIRTARAKGMFEHIIRMRHALRNAMLPVVTLVEIEFAFLIGGLVVTEQVFNLNGLGQLLVDAVEVHDYALSEALVLLVVLVFVLTNFIVDIFYGWLDPRIRYG